ncbi:hypothetical protein [Nubsella zeaxanthinifaciens]|uniref:hypothetical protein n=1 Tax=Nubsella zeaxanthinifaciens TaxID=392412 RepID=UPI000DE49E60|nr:hypothetical protein [Nubsella zeaxanthinifaciens]
MEPYTALTLQTAEDLAQLNAIAAIKSEKIALELYLNENSLWLIKTWKNGIKTGFRTVYDEGNALMLTKLEQTDTEITVSLSTASGKYSSKIKLVEDALFHYTAAFTPKKDLLFAYWPKDILNFTKDWKLLSTGKIHTQQVGNRSAILNFSLNKPATGSIFYFQNLTSLNPYFEHTKTSGAGLIGAGWPEIGFSIPISAEEPLQKNQTYILSDAYVLVDEQVPKDQLSVCKSYLTNLAAIYQQLPKPETATQDWLKIADNGIKDMEIHPGCWSYQGGHHYLTAYLSDYKTPPEIMVQLAVLLPVMEYLDWKGEASHPIVDRLKDGLEAFYKPELGTIVRWLPTAESNLDYSEEQKKPNVMDAWYLHHPLMNLARLTARGGEKIASKLLMDSIGYAMKVAKTFNYQWPVFYEMDTLNILKAETAEGEGGEKDVPGTYADLMLKLWEITGKKSYLNEAKRSVKHLDNLGFDVFYQANNTTFSAVALLKLYKLTKKQHYLDLSYMCLAGIFNNVQLWDSNYGYGKNFPSFFAIFPLKDAPYTAAYEEQEVYAALCYYYEEAKGVELLPAVKMLIAEFIKYAINRVPYYFAAMLPKEMLATEVKTGEIDPDLWIALEDLRDGWEQAGQVGQEVYGAGVAFGIIPRQYHQIKNEDFLVFAEYPLDSFTKRKQQLNLTIGGEGEADCKLQIIIPTATQYDFKLQLKDGSKQILLEPKSEEAGLITYHLKAKAVVSLTWQKKQQ